MYMLFAGSNYYPGGGWDDYKDSFDTLAEALVAAANCGEDWWHIVHDKEVVRHGLKSYSDSKNL